MISSLEIGCKSTTFFAHSKYFFSKEALCRKKVVSLHSQNQHKMGEKNSDKVFIFAGRATENLARRVAEIYGIPLLRNKLLNFIAQN